MNRFLSSLLCLLCFCAVSVFDARAAVTSTASTPDGSLWMGTDGEGLLRIGRNGRRLVYRSSDVTFPSDVIRDLLCDSSGTLWILTEGGALTTYLSTKGFAAFPGLSSPVSAIALHAGALIASTESLQLFRCSAGASPALVSTLPCPVRQLLPAADGALWLLGESAALRLSPEGGLSGWESASAAADPTLLDLKFETEEKVSSSKEPRQKSGFSWLSLLIGLLVGALLFRLFFALFHRAGPARVPAPAPAVVTPPAPRVSETSVPSSPAVKPLSAAPKPLVPEPVPAPAPAPTPAPAPSPAPSPAPAPKPVPKPAAPAPSSFYQEVLRLIERNYIHPEYGVEEMAATLGLSRIHLNRKLKAEANTSPSTMLKEVRMKQARALLDEGKLSVAEISLACGFSTPSYFSTAFREYYGKTPSEYLAAL